MTRDDFAAWLDAYVDAWRTYDREAIGSLFADDVEYRYHAWDEPVRGRDAVVGSWLSNPDDTRAWEASYEPWAVDGRRGVATGTSRYDDANGRRTYHNVFLVEFDESGRCVSFTEVYALQP